MTYSTGSLIEAVDYNTFAQGGASVNHNVANINTIWGTGTGDKGYGQATTLSTVAAGATVSATEWSTMIARLNSILTHQSGSGSGITSPTAGETVSAIATLSSNITTAFNNRKLLNNTRGTPSTTNYDATWSSTTPTTFQQVRTITFASADQARYFFNCGGRIGINLSIPSGGSDNNKEVAWATLTGTNVGTLNFDIDTNGRTGTGGTVSSSNTAVGFYQLTSSDQTLLTIASTTAAYTLNTVSILARCNVASNSSGGATVITFTINYSDGADDNNAVGAGTLDQISMTVRASVTVTPPETTNLTASWGTVTPAATTN